MEAGDLKRYWTDELRWGWQPQSRLTFDFLREAAEFVGTGSVLDAGAGHQRYRPFFARGLYLSQEHPAGVEFKQMQGVTYDFLSPIDERIPLRDDSLDAIISTSVLEHVRHPERFLAEALRVLKPGGRLFVHVPFAYPEHEVPYDFQRPTRYGLQAWLADAGFARVDVRPDSSSTATVLSFLRSAFGQDTLGERTPEFKASPLRALGKWARTRPLAMLGKLALLSLSLPAILWLELMGRLLDRGPHAASGFPIGWLCVAVKGGEHLPRPQSKEDFLRERTAAASG
jgi:SAM-dependent methyltransferase